MARQRRLQFRGAIYHVMARGDRREAIVYADGDRRAWVETLGEMCERTGILVHAYALLDNHFHLVLETPEANLVEGMRWFQNAYTRRFNVYHHLWGHLFGGRYKAIVVDSEGPYFQRVADYVHLNPARAGLAGVANGLERYQWSSLPLFMKAPRFRPGWLAAGRVFACCGLKDTPHGRRALLARLERRLREEGAAKAGLVSSETMPKQSLQATIRRGWYFGSDQFRERMLKLLDEDSGHDEMRAVEDGYNAAQMWDHREAMARVILERGCLVLGLARDQLARRRANDPDKVMLAELIASHTSMPLDWIRSELHMGTRGYCCRLVQQQRELLRHNPILQQTRRRLLEKCHKQ